jgi:aminodeoxyfutalosine synthase
MLEMVRRFDDKDVTEVHIVGGVNPSHDIYYYAELLRKIKEHRPSLHIKAFSAIELDYMIKKASMAIDDGLALLKEYGLNTGRGSGDF